MEKKYWINAKNADGEVESRLVDEGAYRSWLKKEAPVGLSGKTLEGYIEHKVKAERRERGVLHLR